MSGLIIFIIVAVLAGNLSSKVTSGRPTSYAHPTPSSTVNNTPIEIQTPCIPCQPGADAYDKPAPWYVGTWGVGEPSYAEQLIIDELNKYDIEWHREVSFKDLTSPLTGGHPRYDFYLPKYKIAIEYHGQGYHDSPEKIAADKIKEDYCTTNCIMLYVYRVEQYRNMERAVASLMHSIGVPPIK